MKKSLKILILGVLVGLLGILLLYTSIILGIAISAIGIMLCIRAVHCVINNEQ